MRRLRFYRILDRIFPVKYVKKLVVDDEPSRGSFGPDGIEIEIGPEELSTIRHEGGHGAFRAIGLDDRWKERFGEKIALELEEEVVSYLLPVHLDALKRNGVL